MIVNLVNIQKLIFGHYKLEVVMNQKLDFLNVLNVNINGVLIDKIYILVLFFISQNI